MKTPLWRHQSAAVDAALAAPRGGCLWDMGLGTGKTLAALGLIEQSGAGKVLVVAPLAVIQAWGAQFDRHWGGRADLLLLDGRGQSVEDKRDRANAALVRQVLRGQHSSIPAVVVINYESAWREPFGNWALAQEWDLVIADEGHRLKDPVGKASRWFQSIGRRAHRRLALTGTPLPHGPLDAYGLYRYLDPTVFGTSFVRFRSRYAVMGGHLGQQVLGFQNKPEFADRFHSIRYHASRDVLDLPDAVHTERVFTLPPKAATVYRRLVEDFYSRVESGEITVTNALTKLLRLQQVTSGYVTLDDEGTCERQIQPLHDEKREQLIEVLDALPVTEPVVVFARFVRDLDEIHAAARETGRQSLELSGRVKELGHWQSGSGSVLAVQIGAGAEGIDLTRAAHAVFYSIGFSLAQYTQALARTHRPGQHRTCYYHHLIAEGTVDRKVYQALGEKAEVIRAILAAVSSRA